jgi:hypothetical protein
LLNGDKNWLEEGLLLPAKKNKRKRIVEKGSSSATQDEGGVAHQANKQPHGGIPMPPPYGEYQCLNHIMKCADVSGGVGQPYRHLLHRTWRTTKLSWSLIQTNASQMEEGTSTIILQARIHRARPSISTTGR